MESGENLALQAAVVAGQAVGHAEATRNILAPVVTQCTQLLQQMDGRMQEKNRQRKINLVRIASMIFQFKGVLANFCTGSVAS